MTSGEDTSREAAPAAFPGGSPPPEGIAAPSGIADPSGSVELAHDTAPAAAVRSFAEDLRDLAGDAQTLFEAEKAYEGARLRYALGRGKGVALSFVLAGALLYFAMIAAVVGLLLALAPLLTAWGALAVVTLALALGAFLFLRSGLKRLQRMRLFLGADAGGAADAGSSS